ncbi:LOG family protein [Candidatus Saganbacteria bacterium]|nr:LOG family protein [Candidatus Saganbacteria bacterium]
MDHKQEIYCTGDPVIDREIEKLAARYSTPHSRFYLRELFTTVIKLYLDEADEHNLYMANVTLKELRHIFRTFTKYRGTRKVVIFGSHRTPAKAAEYKMAQAFAEEMVKLGYMVITGGGGGVMEAGNKGAGNQGFAIKIKLPLEMAPNPYVIRGEKLINVRYFFTRKLTFIKESDATVLFPGGFGTHDEGYEVLTLLQTGRCLPRPVIFIDPPGCSYWKQWRQFLEKALLKDNYITKNDFGIFSIVNSVPAAVKEITNFYRIYNSIVYGKDMTVIRLNQRVSEKGLKNLSRQYRDIMTGEIKPCGPLPNEVRTKEFLDLPRIGFDFDRKSYNRLIQLIKDINQAGLTT